MSADKLPKITVSDGFIKKNSEADSAVDAVPELVVERPQAIDAAREIGGRGGLDPTRFGDWEKNGRCIDF